MLEIATYRGRHEPGAGSRRACGRKSNLMRLLQLLLQEVLWRMSSLVVDVDVGAFHIRERFELHLEFFRNVVSLAQTHLLVHDNVDFDDETWTGVPGTHRVERQDARIMRHGDVGDMLQEGRVRGHTNEQLKFLVGSSCPEEGDKHREDDGTHRIDPPSNLASENASHQTKAVDKKVIPVILPENVNLTVLVPERPAVQE